MSGYISPGFRSGGSIWGIRRRRSTRWVVLAAISLMLVYAGACPWVTDKDAYLRLLTPFVLLMTIAVSASPFRIQSRRRDEAVVFDEFQRDTLQRATMRSFQVLLLLVGLVFGWLCVASSFRWPMPAAPQDWFLWGGAILYAGLLLPILFAEFTIPMPPEAEAQEDLML
ncbi:hypothetical protein [uncultured Sphingomonas sp.]|uniref:hypothetical protein n=1 Tax=uncultured Sphingomonas sp. TaxID=158754 RepID=UPI0025E37AC6|nr:hypothetical protein [uncultured Sphingomonas sp.]